MIQPHNLSQACKETLALVMAGGKGSRLRQLTDNQSKPAVPFGGKFILIDFPLSNCINSGIRRMGILTQYKAHTLIKHIQKGWSFLQPELNEFVEIWPAQQQTDKAVWYQGTADAIYQNISIIKEHHPKYVLILSGDHVYKQDYSKVMDHFLQCNAQVLISCIEVPVATATAFGVVGADENDVITSFVEKPANPPHIPGKEDRAYASMGIYLFETEYLIDLLEKDAADPNSEHDFGKNIMPKIIGNPRFIAHSFNRSCVFNNTDEPYWRDVGTVDSYWSANIDLTNVVPDLDMYDESWPIWTFQKQLPPAKFVFESELRTGAAYKSLVSPGCIISGGIVRRSLLFSSVHIHSFTMIEDSVILNNCIVNRHAKIRRAILAQDCVIPRGLLIGYNLEEDRKYFHVSDNGIVLVTPEMLKNVPINHDYDFSE